jgi:hypothetical protein
MREQPRRTRNLNLKVSGHSLSDKLVAKVTGVRCIVPRKNAMAL